MRERLSQELRVPESPRALQSLLDLQEVEGREVEEGLQRTRVRLEPRRQALRHRASDLTFPLGRHMTDAGTKDARWVKQVRIGEPACWRLWRAKQDTAQNRFDCGNRKKTTMKCHVV